MVTHDGVTMNSVGCVPYVSYCEGTVSPLTLYIIPFPSFYTLYYNGWSTTDYY